MNYALHQLFGPYCMDVVDAQALYDHIHPVILVGQAVEVDCSGVQVFSGPFLSTAFGQLYQDISPEQIDCLLAITHVVPLAQSLLQRVMANAQRYHTDPVYQAAVDHVTLALSEEA